MEHGLTRQRRTRARASSLEFAISAARRIRRNLVRHRGNTELGGDCGLASLFLADALGDVDSLRLAHTEVIRGVEHVYYDSIEHVFNLVNGTIIDITATQFNDLVASAKAGEPPVFNVLITREPRIYHRRVIARGREVHAYLAEAGWYEDQEHRRLPAVLRRLGSIS